MICDLSICRPRLLLVWLVALGLAGAALAQPPALEIRVRQLLSDQTLRPLASGDTLVSGDWVGFSVRVDQPAYIYVAQVFADGSAALHFPEGAGDVRLEPGRELPIPGGGYYFQLDDEVGEERVYFIASERPLKDVDQRLDHILQQIGSRGLAPEKGSGADDWDDFGMPGRRGLHKRLPDFDKVRAGEDGVAVFPFVIQHR